MSNNYLFPAEPNKVIKSYTIDGQNVDWMKKHIAEGEQSKFVNALIARYIKRREAIKAREQSLEIQKG